jgi:deoxyribose-phosphate aldolase
MNHTRQQVAAAIDHTLLRPEATVEQVWQLVAEAGEHRFATVCVNPIHVLQAAGVGVRVCSVAGFPLGASVPRRTAAEAMQAVEDGAMEIDFVAHLPHLLACDMAAAANQFSTVVERLRQRGEHIVTKVIIESALLMADVDADMAERRIATACAAARHAGVDFVKTSTGFHPAGGATVEAVALMKKHGQGLKVKASGGIRTWDHAVAMLDAGADRLGCSAGIDIIATR